MATLRRSPRGFTLVEMLVVLGIMTALAAIAIPVYLGSRASTRRSGAENAVQAALSAAREAAIQHRCVAAVKFHRHDDATDPLRGETDSMTIWYSGADGVAVQIGAPIPLPNFIEFNWTSLTLVAGWGTDSRNKIGGPNLAGIYDIVYAADGTVADPEGTTDIVLMDTTELNAYGQNVSTVLMVLPATGLTVEVGHYEDPAGATGVYGKGWL